MIDWCSLHRQRYKKNKEDVPGKKNYREVQSLEVRGLILETVRVGLKSSKWKLIRCYSREVSENRNKGIKLKLRRYDDKLHRKADFEK